MIDFQTNLSPGIQIRLPQITTYGYSIKHIYLLKGIHTYTIIKHGILMTEKRNIEIMEVK